MYELTCVGCGPGDPDLLTIKAAYAIKNADIILCPTSKKNKPSIAFSIASKLITKKPKIVTLIFPMTKDKKILEDTWKKNSKIIAKHALTGKNVIYITIGDPYLYSTWIYIHRQIKSQYPEITIKVIPGIVSIFTFSAKVGIELAEGSDKLTIIPSCYDLSQVNELAKNCETMVFLKDGKYFNKILQILQNSGFSDNAKIILGQNLDTEKELITTSTLGKIINDTSFQKQYFSIMVVKRV